MAKKRKTKRPAAGRTARRQARPAARKARAVSPVPPGVHTVTPNLALRDAAAAMDFYARAFGAAELMRMPGPGGNGIMHAEVRIGDSILYLEDGRPQAPIRPPGPDHQATASIWLYLRDCEAVYQKAVAAGASTVAPPADMWWGDRVATVTDPFGVTWGLATHVKDMTAKELAEAAARAMPPPSGQAA